MAHMEKKDRKKLCRIILSAILFTFSVLLPTEGIVRFLVFLVVYLSAGSEVLLRAGRNLLHGQIFDENFLMALATVGAFALGDYAEGVMVMIFYNVGELFESYAVGKSRRSITDLMNIRPDYANLERDGALVKVDPYDVRIGDIIVVKSGEKIPLDGIVLEGHASADTSALTGESIPRELVPGSDALSGCINLNGLLSIRVTKEFDESTASKILDLVEHASSKKAKTEAFITKFARYYTPSVVFTAAALSILPPLLLPGQHFAEWVRRALTFLVISCPCALVISVPLGFFGGIGGASKRGILVKGSNCLEALSKVGTVVFDKTGTLTKGSFRVTAVRPVNGDHASLLATAALAECYSGHPVAQSILTAYGEQPDRNRVSFVEEIAGRGVRATIDGETVLAGNARLLADSEVSGFTGLSTSSEAAGDTASAEIPRLSTTSESADSAESSGTVVYLACGKTYLGSILIADEIKPDAAQTIAQLKNKCGIRKVVMLSGDHPATAQAVASELGIDTVYAGLLPADKVEKVEELLELENKNSLLAFVGDGINDAPVLARSDIGIAMGGLGSDAAIEAADIVIMDDMPLKITSAIDISKKTMRIVKQNIIFALCTKGVVLLLGAFGLASMWAAVFADVGVSTIAIINSMRAQRT